MDKVVAIDGPAASGKSTIARQLARKLGWSYCDTGALYRAVTLSILEASIPIDNVSLIQNHLKLIEISFDETHVFLKGKNVTLDIRSQSVNNNVSQLSKQHCVRQFLIHFQKNIVQKGFVVMEGRDIGTRISPHAQHKFYLEGSLKTRAMRRFRELSDLDPSLSFTHIENNLRERDSIDINRSESPLTRADNAIVIDTNPLSAEEVVNTIYQKMNDS